MSSRNSRPSSREFTNQGYRPRPRSLSRNNSSRPSSGSAGNNSVRCHWCGIPGHVQSNCWRRLRLCFRCGSPDHRLRFCPHPDMRGITNSAAPTENPTPTPAPRNNFSSFTDQRSIHVQNPGAIPRTPSDLNSAVSGSAATPEFYPSYLFPPESPSSTPYQSGQLPQ